LLELHPRSRLLRRLARMQPGWIGEISRTIPGDIHPETFLAGECAMSVPGRIYSWRAVESRSKTFRSSQTPIPPD
jgi:collagenase-like PrtC family protease